MIQIRRNAIVRYTPPQMFDLVNDVEAYPRRFAWCAGARVLARDDATVTARLELRLGAMTQAFTTRNTLTPPQRVGIQLVDGPFRYLAGIWDFAALGDEGCKVSLALDFDFSGGLMAPLMRTGFQKLADHLVDEFCAEAQRVYG